MTWKAPELQPTRTLVGADERPMLQSWLDFHRQTLLGTCGGLDGEQLAARSVKPSSLSLLGLVRHLTEVERGWFRLSAAGEEV
ncbi:mycothiol transferase [Nocardia sp. IBHARD005]|uniref:mycothiol transferase n=1 Tax=Nocardia sp. IBHARD005 TaxID=3457765 RepID=UPI004059E600